MRSKFAVFLIFFLAIGINAQDRGLSIPTSTVLDSVIGKQWAVFIAIDRYQDWMPLANPVRDAKEIRDILTEHYYIDDIIELYDQDATAAGIRQLFVNLRSRVARDDSVFIFYAGHGQTDPFTNTGFWIPADGGRDMMSQTNWLPNIQIRNLVSQLPARHVFLVSDSCFSGDMLDITRGAGPVIDSEYFKRAYSRVSRQVMTSGASEAVPDASEFAMRMKSSLLRAEESFIDPHYLFTSVREVRSSQPMLGSIRGSEHQEGGSFLFFRKTAASPTQERRVVRPEAAPYMPGSGGLPEKNRSAHLWTVGASVGSSFSAPWLIGTVRGTIAPLPYSFLELGFAAGIISGAADVGYYSLYPFAHYALFLPFTLLTGTQGLSGGWYIGAGGGYMLGEYDFLEGKTFVNYFTANFTTGFNIMGFLDISYTLRTDFENTGSTVSVGYTYRFW